MAEPIAIRKALPDFVGIGALKAGTSYLDTLLRGHPEILLPTHMKETEYFSRHYDRGPGWYLSQYGSDPAACRGEISPQYLFDSRCAQRIYLANASAKIFLSVRNPVDRVISQYRYWKQETGYSEDLESFLAEHPGALTRSCYYKLLEPWLRTFPIGSIHVIVFDDLITEPSVVNERLLNFLGVDTTYRPPGLARPANVSGTPRFRRVYALSKTMSRSLYAHRGARVVEVAKSTGVARILRGSPHSPETSSDSVDDAVRRKMRGLFLPDVDQLSSLVGRDLVQLWDLED